MRMKGDEFWKSLGSALGSKLVATFKLAFHPGNLIFLQILTFNSNFITRYVRYNTISKRK